MKIKYYSNGFIVRETNKECYGIYRGVDGVWWDRYDDYSINVDIYDSEYVDVCTDLDTAIKYAKHMAADDKEIDILYCCTTIELPQIILPDAILKEQFEFIGYDYAYQNGSFYSCVFFDISRRKELDHHKINEYGLIQTEEEMNKFIFERNSMWKKDKIRFESGGFIVYKLWRYVGKL